MSRFWLCLAIVCLPASAFAEPYLAVRSGGKCMMCHTNPTGGGKRNAFGNVYAQRTLASRYIDAGGDASSDGDGDAAGWNGSVGRYLAVGADLRTEWQYTDVPDQGSTNAFAHEESLLYMEFKPVPGRFSLYLDERMGPGGATTREAYGLFWLKPNTYYLKAGQFFLPFGLRIEDDDAFIRSATGINYNTPEDGFEFGLEQGRWSAQLALTEGSGQSDDKRSSINVSHNWTGWRLGGSYNTNDTGTSEREMVGVYAGVQTGPISWLAEYDRITDTEAGMPDTEQEVSLIEGNWLISKGNNLKVSYEHRDNIDIVDESRDRWSVVWEHFPIQYLQFSAGLRAYEAPAGDNTGNRDIAFAQLHFFF